MKLAACAIVAFFLLVSSADARETAEPLFTKTAWSKSPNGKRAGTLLAATNSGLEARYLVLGKEQVGKTTWIALRIPRRPNNIKAWVPLRRLQLRSLRAKLYLSLQKRKLSLFLGGKRVWKTSVVVGKSSTPTPRGSFALWDRYRDFGSMRPWVFTTTAHSRALRTFNGAEARIALHGRHDSLWAPWGTASSNGCIRTPDWALRSIRKRAPLGTLFQVR